MLYLRVCILNFYILDDDDDDFLSPIICGLLYEIYVQQFDSLRILFQFFLLHFLHFFFFVNEQQQIFWF